MIDFKPLDDDAMAEKSADIHDSGDTLGLEKFALGKSGRVADRQIVHLDGHARENGEAQSPDQDRFPSRFLHFANHLGAVAINVDEQGNRHGRARDRQDRDRH